jgi:hypothetical protein
VEKVAAATDKSFATVRCWELGKSRMVLAADEMLRICELYCCSLDELARAALLTKMSVK